MNIKRGGTHLKQNSHLSKNGKKVNFHSKEDAIRIIACILILASLPFNSSIIIKDKKDIEIVDGLSFKDNYSFEQDNGMFIIDDKIDLVRFFIREFKKRGLDDFKETSIDGKILNYLTDILNGFSNVEEQLSYLDYLVSNPEFLWNNISLYLADIDTKILDAYPEIYILNAEGCSREDVNISLENIALIRSNTEIMDAINKCSVDYGIPVEILVAMASENVVNGRINTANPLGINTSFWRKLVGEEYVMNFTTGKCDKVKKFYSKYSDTDIMSIEDSVKFASLIYAACLQANDRNIYNALASYKVGTTKWKSQDGSLDVIEAGKYANDVINYIIADSGYALETQLSFKSERLVEGKPEGVAYIRSEYAIREYYNEIIEFINDFVCKFKYDEKTR